jgi:hypothetical protein
MQEQYVDSNLSISSMKISDAASIAGHYTQICLSKEEMGHSFMPIRVPSNFLWDIDET